MILWIFWVLWHTLPIISYKYGWVSLGELAKIGVF
jgi:hypothetical protein